MMQMLSGFPRDVVAFVWHDDMSASEFQSALASAARSEPAGKHDIKLFAKLAEDHSGEDTTSLDDAMLGAGNWRDFGRIAIVTDETWVRHMVQFFAPFVHGPVRVFSNAQSEDARRWLMRRDLD
jgi:stage II sporulation SpoAA-like protein